MINNHECDVAIVGGGVIGCSIARELSEDHEVTLLEKSQIASGATGHATGNTSVVNGFHNNPDLAHYCMNFFREYDGTGHMDYTERPRVTLIPEGMEEEGRRIANESQSNGFDTNYMDTSALEETYPGVFNLDGYVGGIHYKDIGWVDPHTYTKTLQDDAESAGADFRMNVGVEDLIFDGNMLAGVQTEAGTIGADTVVVAAGWNSRALLESYIELPIYPFRWQAVDLDPHQELADNYPMGLDLVDGFYWRAEHNGNIHVGGGEYKVQNPGSIRTNVKESYRHRVAELMPNKINCLENASFVGEHTCESGDTATPDTDPIIDVPDNGPSDLVVATGFHGCGIMASPAAARAVRSLITSEECPFPINQYALNRFATTSNNFEFTPLLSAYGDM